MSDFDTGKRRLNLWPLPGGRHNYLVSLRKILELAADPGNTTALADRITATFPEVHSGRTAKGYAKVPVALGLLDSERRSGNVSLTPEGRRFLRSGSPAIIRAALVQHVAGVDCILRHIAAGADDFNHVRQLLERENGLAWGTPMPVRYRVWWLVSCGAVDSIQDGRRHRLTITSAGRRLLSPAP